MQKKLLEGIRVAEFAWFIAGPITGKTLADHGAEVIRVESRSRPDPHRNVFPFKDDITGLDRAGRFHPYNTSKLSMALNLSHSKGVEIAKRLVSYSDIVVENFAGGVMNRMGLGYEELKKVKPDIIMLSSCMQGQTGPHASSQGFGWQLTALSGFFSIGGWPDREPLGPGGPYTDYVAPYFTVLAIMAALDYRRRTRKGQYIDMSQYENGIHFITPLILDYVVNKRVAGRMGNHHAYAAPHSAYRCRGEDRWCTIAVFTEEEWNSFCKVLGNPTWTKDKKFTTLATRKRNEDELDKLIEESTLKHSPEAMMSMFQESGVPAGIVQVTGEDILDNDPQLAHRHFLWELEHPELGKHRNPGSAFTLSKSPYEVRRAPLLGEHNEYVLKQLLNLSDDEIADLVIEGVVE